MIILLCKLSIKSEGTRFLPTLDNEITMVSQLDKCLKFRSVREDENDYLIEINPQKCHTF